MRVSDIKSLLRPDRDFASIAVERAISEIRSGRPVLIRAGRSLAIAVGVEGLDDGAAYLLESLARGRARLALTAPRLKKLGFDRSGPGVIALPLIDVKRIQTLAMDIGARYDAPAAHLSKLDKAAMELVRLSLVAPAVIVVPVAAKSIAGTMLATVDASAIETYRAHQVTELSIVSRAPCRWKVRRRPNSLSSAAARVCATRSPSSSAGPICRSRWRCVCTRPV